MMTKEDVVFKWSDDGLKVELSSRKEGVDDTLSLSWDNLSKIPSHDKLASIFVNYINTTDERSPISEAYTKRIELPFDKEIDMGFMNSSGGFDEALFKVGPLNVSFPISRDNKLVLKAPKFKKSDVFGFGAGGTNKAAWIKLRDKKD